MIALDENQRVNQALRDSDARLQVAVKASRIGLWEWDVASNRVFASPEWKQLIGCDDDEVPTNLDEWELLLHPDDKDRVRLQLAARLAGRSPNEYQNEFRLRHKDGSYRWIYTRAELFRDSAGKPVRMLGCHMDINERKQAEEALRNNEMHLRAIIENEPECVKIVSANGKLLEMNQAGLAMLQAKSLTEAQRHTLLEFIVPEHRVAFGGLHKRVMNGESGTLEFEVIGLEGARRWLETHAAPFRNAAGEVQHLLGITRDITERKLIEEKLRESEAKFRGLIEQSTDGIFVSDAEGNLLLANSRWYELLGYEKDQAAGINAKQTYLEEEREVHAKRLEQVRMGQTLRFERIVKRRDGSTFPAEISLKMLDDGCVQGIFHDITERRKQESKIARLSRIQAVLSGINSAIVRIRDRQELLDEACRIAAMHGAFRIAWFGLLNQATGEMGSVASVGFDAGFFEKLMHATPKGTFGPHGVGARAFNERRTFIDNDIMANPDINLLQREAVNRGCRSVIGLPLTAEGVTVGSFMLYAEEKDFFDDEEVKLLTELAGDISFGLEFIAKEEKVDYLAYYDALSGLPNRSLFFDRLTHQLGSAARDGLNVALVIMDIDRFRLVNDTLGRQAGDALIGTVAQRIKDTFRDQDTVARVGANSFAVAVSGTWQAADAARVLKSHAHQLFGQPFLLGKEELRMSASAGVAVFPGDGDSPEALFANAEAALKKAKAGSERLLFYSPGMNARVADSLRLENKLRRALDNGELVLWYQPKVSVRTREILGFEALMRWRDPESTLMVPPAQFIPLMEQTGLILDAGSWAMSQVARDCRTWSASGMKLPRVAVNVSPIQLRQKDFVATVIEAAHKTEEAGSMLDLEITESVIMDNVEAIIPLLQSVRNLGVEIAVDDFGTGYSSLAYIARLPIQELKIDRSFVVGMTQNADSLAIVRSVISLAHALRLNVVAEGVETEEQAALLLELGCDVMQGYLISRPVAPEQIPDLVRQQRLAIPDAPAKQVSSAKKKAAGTKPSVKRR